MDVSRLIPLGLAVCAVSACVFVPLPKYVEPTSPDTATIYFTNATAQLQNITIFEGDESCTNKRFYIPVAAGATRAIRVSTTHPFTHLSSWQAEAPGSGTFGALSTVSMYCKVFYTTQLTKGQIYLAQYRVESNKACYETIQGSGNVPPPALLERTFTRPLTEEGSFCAPVHHIPEALKHIEAERHQDVLTRDQIIRGQYGIP